MDTIFSAKKALILDKRHDDLRTLRELLLRLGVGQVMVASSVNMALSILREESVDLCFMVYDLGKGEKSGLQLMYEAQAEGLYRYGTSYILVADTDAAALMFGSLESSPDLCIDKPYNEAQVRLSLERLLRLKLALSPLDVCMDKAHWVEALSLCEQKLEQFPALRIFLQRLQGIILLKLGRYVQARTLFDRLLSERDQHWMRVGVGVAAYHQGDLVQAEDSLAWVIRQQQVCVDAFNWLARLHRLKGDLQQSVILLRKSVLLQPSVAFLQSAQGHAAAQVKDWRLAVDSFRAAVRFGRYSAFQSPENYFALAQALKARMDNLQGPPAEEAEREAIQVLEQVVEDFDHDPVAQFRSRLLLADLLRQCGDRVRAEQAGRAALGLFEELPLERRAQWLDQLTDGLEQSESASHALAVRHALTPKMAGIDWASANIRGMKQFRKAALTPARDNFIAAYQAQPGNPSVGLNLVQTELELLRQSSAGQPVEGIRRCDDILHGLQYAALTQRQQQRYQTLAERLALQVRTRLMPPLPDQNN
ncbi:tetratricopeptide repeat protein [Marinobacterium halophilum]|uniref:Tetratricopeptide repeat protein n=1 Tax=Marinobacterium halophilum TaxID=267374 RepID=A0A2P8F3L2_9GAMM|nr:tetratricopeptide repeat protein [Marinobacterium halophilum]PSL16307.1 tetratricopeptide repeat protein [Marinobacterium halophilum]